ncbi:glycine-rich RNA-binding protein 3, mitochondrial-like [Chenopodium quinoa]|uniref:RRM domain-containing protein n=1 Tax=Chenopodium quinoa TaxID=63459 RepID=A0A803N136_CHEQI|nr:glycine-rich RNA-binding protein 3, mitochondrial-like [Chenopodium quinoa]
MAFINKIGNILKQTSHKLQILEPSVPNAPFHQAIRCFSSSKLFIGGLSFATDENSLREAFLPYGDVVEARVIFDRESGRSRGFGFVSYASAEEASSAIQALDGRELHGRFLRVAYAADQRLTSPGPSFSGASGYGDSFRGNDSYGTVTSHTGGKFSGGDSNNANGGYDSFSNAGFGNTGEYSDGNCSRPNAGIYEGFSANENGATNYTASPDSFKTHYVSNGADGGRYIQNAGNDFGGSPGSGYGAAFGRCSFENGSHGPTGNYSSSRDGKGIADSYNTTNNGFNSFIGKTPCTTMRQGNGNWQGHNLDTSNNCNNQDEPRGNIYDNGYVNSRFG